jgi:hypothetical protein
MAKDQARSGESTLTAHPDWIPCGDTPVEARSAGCHYEPMQRSWIPDACYFPEPSNEYDPFSDRDWYLDKNLTKPADLEKLRNGEGVMA